MGPILAVAAGFTIFGTVIGIATSSNRSSNTYESETERVSNSRNPSPPKRSNYSYNYESKTSNFSDTSRSWYSNESEYVDQSKKISDLESKLEEQSIKTARLKTLENELEEERLKRQEQDSEMKLMQIKLEEQKSEYFQELENCQEKNESAFSEKSETESWNVENESELLKKINENYSENELNSNEPSEENSFVENLKNQLNVMFEKVEFKYNTFDDKNWENEINEFFEKQVINDYIQVYNSFMINLDGRNIFNNFGGNYIIYKIKRGEEYLAERTLIINFQEDKEIIIQKMLELSIDLHNSLKINEIIKENKAKRLNETKGIAFEYERENKKLVFCFYYKFYKNENLSSSLKLFNNLELKIRFAYSLAEGIAELDQHEIYHGDLSPGNILIDDELNPIIHDFETTKFGNTSSTSFIVEKTTIRYASYETIRNSKNNCLELYFNQTSNVYSFGCILFYLFTETEPWSFIKFEDSYKENYKLIDFLKYTKDDLMDSYQAKFKWEPYEINQIFGYNKIFELIKNCTLIDYKERMKSHEIIKELEALC